MILPVLLIIFWCCATVVCQLPQTEEDRKAWCAAVRKEHHMTDSGNTLAVLPKSQRDSYLRLCVNTPGSVQSNALAQSMRAKEKDLAEVLGHPLKDVQRFCEETKERYSVIPGQDFGTMPAHIHPLYLRARCYRFFCEPHERAGLGKFDCVPLKKPYEGD